MEKTFGELTREEKLTLLTAWVDEAPVEFKIPGDAIWRTTKFPSWSPRFAYRIATTPDKIPWDVVDERFVCSARVPSGIIHVFKKKPRLLEISWSVTGNEYCALQQGIFTNIVPGTCDWRDSLQWRPGCEPEEVE